MSESIEDLFPLYALGGLSDDERRRVDAYVASNPEARARLTELMETAEAVPFAARRVDPSPRVKQALMDRVRADARPESPAAASRFGLAAWLRNVAPALAGAGIVVAVAAGIWALSLNAEVARLSQEVAALRVDLAAQRQVIAAVSRPGVRALSLAGTDIQPGAHGQLLADPQAPAAVLVVDGLGPLPSGRVYQFWLIRGNQPVSAGVFTVDAQGSAVVGVSASGAIGTFDAMGVSVEPDGGSPQPTGDIVMLSTLS